MIIYKFFLFFYVFLCSLKNFKTIISLSKTMISCKVVRKNLVFPPQDSKLQEKTAEKSSFSIKNFRLLTSHLKSRRDFQEIPEENARLPRDSSQRPRTTPNFYWNFLSFEERKQQSQSKSSVEKTLQRLNIRILTTFYA